MLGYVQDKGGNPQIQHFYGGVQQALGTSMTKPTLWVKTLP